MIEVKYLSDADSYATVLKALKEVLGKHYTGSLNKEKYAPYWVDAIATYRDGDLFDIQLFDPYHEVAHGINVNSKGSSGWLYRRCSDKKKMCESGLSAEEIACISKLKLD